MKLSNIKSFIRSPFLNKLYYHFFFCSPFYKRLVNDNYKKALDLSWNAAFTNPINWDCPQTLNEKIQWLQLNTDTALWSKYADKYEVRLHLKELGLTKYLTKLYGVWNSPYDINYNDLPEKFVLKCTHDCRSTMIIDRSKADVEAINKKANYFLKRKYGYSTGERHYLRIKPRIIAEELLENTCPSISSSMVDYKVLCFNGTPSYIMTIHGRTKKCMMRDLYDTNWNRSSELLVFSDYYRDGKGEVPQPKSLREMLEVSTILSKGFPQVRIDFYDVDGRLYFGEMTFTGGCGRMTFFSEAAQHKLGEMINLPKQ